MESKFLQSLRGCRTFSELDDLEAPFLNEDSPKVPVNLPGLTISLLPFQRTSIYAMMNLERSRAMVNPRLNVQISAGVLADKPGTGKTFMILGLIAADMCNPPGYLDPPNRPANISNIEIQIDKDVSIVVKREYKYTLRPNFIFTSGASIKQFAKAIERFTTFKYLLVQDLYGLNRMYTMIRDGKLGEYDIVLVKNGKIAYVPQAPFRTEFTNHKTKTTATMMDAFGALSLGLYRAFIDDYDTADAPKYHIALPARFTWYVSSTERKQTRVVKQKTRPMPKTFEESLLYQYHQSSKILSDKYMRLFTVRNDPKFIKKYNGLTKPIVYLCKFEDPDKYVALIQRLHSNNVGEIIDRINAGAIEEAARIAEAETPTSADIFRKLLRDRYEEYKKAAQVIKNIQDIRAIVPKLPPRDGEGRYTKLDIVNGIMPECQYDFLNNLLQNTDSEYQQSLHTCTNVINRVRESLIGDGECLICTMGLKTKNTIVIMASCCSCVLCGDCVGYYMEFHNVDNKVIAGKPCPKCRHRDINFNDLIYIKPVDLELIDIPLANGNAVDALLYESPVKKPPSEEKGEEKKRHSTKELALVDIIRGIVPYEAVRINRKINIQQGDDSREIKHDGPPKILIYAMYSESVSKIYKAVMETGINYLVLGGSPKKIQETIDLFDKSQQPCVLIVNGMKYCSGLNLQAATHTVLYHKIAGGNEVQIIGRSHRLMRPSTAIVYYFMYENELEEFDYDPVVDDAQVPIGGDSAADDNDE